MSPGSAPLVEQGPTQQLANCAPDETAGTIALKTDHRYSNVEVLIAPSDNFTTPAKLDVVWTALDYHDLHDKFMVPTNVGKLIRPSSRR